MLNLLYFLVFIAGTVQIFREYHYILDYKRDERTFHEYEKSKKEDLQNIVDDPNSAPF